MGNARKSSQVVLQVLTELAKNPKEDSALRSRAAEGLGNAEKLSDATVQVLTQLANNSREFFYLRLHTAEALLKVEKLRDAAMQVLIELAKNPKEDTLNRGGAVNALGNAGKSSEVAVQVLAQFAQNSREDPYLRGSSALALGNAGKSNPAAAQVLTQFATDPKADFDLRSAAVSALRDLRPLALSEFFVSIEQIRDRKSPQFSATRFAAYFSSGGSRETKTLLKWIVLPKPESFPTQLTYDEAKTTLAVFATAWKSSEGLIESQSELVRAIVAVTQLGKWQPSDIPLLEQHYKNLSEIKSNRANEIKTAIDALKSKKRTP